MIGVLRKKSWNGDGFTPLRNRKSFRCGPILRHPVAKLQYQWWSPTTMLANTTFHYFLGGQIFYLIFDIFGGGTLPQKCRYPAYQPLGQLSHFGGQIQMSWRANLWPTAISPALRYVYRLNKNATVEKKFNLRFRIIPEIVEGRLQPVKTFRTFRLHILTDAFALDFCLDDVVYKVYSRRRRAL